MIKKILKKTKGLTLAETLVAAGIAAFALVGLLQAFLANIYLSDLAKGNTVAIDDLKDMMEKIQSAPFSDMLADFPNGTVNGPVGRRYNTTVVGNYALRNESITVTYVNPASDPLEVIVNVTWTDSRRGTHSNYLTTKKTR
jgi:Tfp pilus assembly protein PilV